MKKKTRTSILRTLGVLLILSILLTVQLATTAARGPYPEGLVLWNKLGSPEEVINPPVGPGFNTNPVVSFVPGKYGGAAATEGECAYLSMDSDDFFAPDKTQGTVEVWIQKRMQEFFPFTTPMIGIFGYHPYGDLGCGNYGYTSISAFWSDGYTGNGGIQFQIRDSNGNWHSINDLQWNNVEVGEWVHLAFVWDLDGIEGPASDTMRIYRDGGLVVSTAEAIPDIMPNSNEVRLLGHHAYHRFGQPTAYLDNIKVWDYAKTDFADRFKEPPNLPPNCDIADPDGDPLAITITGVWPEPPMGASSSGNASPNGLGGDISFTENEYEGLYRINFTFNDGYGGMCSGEVLVHSSIPMP